MFRKRSKRSIYDDKEVEPEGEWLPPERRKKKKRKRGSDADTGDTDSDTDTESVTSKMESGRESAATVPEQPVRHRRERRRIRYTTENEIRLALLEFLIFVIFLILATIVCLSVRHSYMFYFNQTIEKFFVTRLIQAGEDKLMFTELLTIHQYWDFMILCFLPTLHAGEASMKEYDKELQDNPGFVEDFENDPYRRRRKRRGQSGGSGSRGTGWFKFLDPNDTSPEGIFLYENLLLGPPRLRQIRVEVDSCRVNEKFVHHHNNCYAEYSSSYEDTSDEHKTTFYKTLSDLNAYNIHGQIATYDSGGYVKDLTYNGPKNIAILKALREKKWIDRGTRLVVMEFNLFNQNTDLYESVKLLCEFLPTGSIVTSAKMRVIKKYSFWDDPSYQLQICYIAFYVMVVYYTIMCVNDFRILLFWYFTDILNLFDIVILIFAYLAILYNSFHRIQTYFIQKHVEENLDNFYSLDRLVYWNMLYIDMMGIMVFLVWIKIFRFISFNKTLIQFTWTLRKCAKDLFGFSLMFIIVFLAFAQLGLLLFGTKHPEFVNFTKSMLMMIRLILTDFEYPLIESANRVLGPVFFLSYIMLVYFILLNMFLAIIMETYNAVKNYTTRDSSILGWFLAIRIRVAYQFICRCGRPPERKLRRDSDDAIREHERATQLRESTVLSRESKYFDDVPKDVSNKELYRLENRISLLEELVDQVNTKMDVITRRYDRELEMDRELEEQRRRVRELEHEERMRENQFR